VCDVPETCDGTSDDCPADAFAPPGTPCDDENICTVSDHCVDGRCSGVFLCEAQATSIPIRQLGRSSTFADVNCTDKTDTGLAACEAESFVSSAGLSIDPNDVDCEESGAVTLGPDLVKISTKAGRSFDKDGAAAFKLKLNALGRRALRKLLGQAAGVDAVVCVTFSAKDGSQVTLKEVVTLAKRKAGA
jgi:hypothetical protein